MLHMQSSVEPMCKPFLAMLHVLNLMALLTAASNACPNDRFRGSSGEAAPAPGPSSGTGAHSGMLPAKQGRLGLQPTVAKPPWAAIQVSQACPRGGTPECTSEGTASRTQGTRAACLKNPRHASMADAHTALPAWTLRTDGFCKPHFAPNMLPIKIGPSSPATPAVRWITTFLRRCKMGTIRPKVKWEVRGGLRSEQHPSWRTVQAFMC
jgi:hypothetical protein